MEEQTTVKADHGWKTPKTSNPSGLLLFFPSGRPPRMQNFVVGKKELDIGRSESCQVQLDDTEASRRHALIQTDGDHWTLTDCGSTNGVFVNGGRVTTSPLHGGEVIRIGMTLMRFLEQGVSSRDEHVPVQSSGLVGGPSLDPAREWLDIAADSDVTALVTGETGTGKEVAARQIHQASPRADGPFVPVNCAAIPADLVESELFGHVRGAFSGASTDTPGLFRQAHGGSLLLDEIGEISPDAQAKLLRVLQDRQVRPVGGSRFFDVDVKVICATNRNLKEMVRRGEFREDLLARIALLQILLPPLRQRVEDIPLLVNHFIRKHGARHLKVPVEVMELLCCKGWPQNVRQLEGAVQRAILFARGAPALDPQHFELMTDEEPEPPARSATDEPVLDEPAVRQLHTALQQHRGDPEQAAAQLGISRSQLYRRAKKFGLSVPSYRK